jgi:hypothetical protein
MTEISKGETMKTSLALAASEPWGSASFLQLHTDRF